MTDLSIIIPTYQAENTLERCVLSILTNDISMEILIVDDGSCDATAQICHRLSQNNQKIRAWSQENAGPGAARAFALQKATGRFVTFVDADDYLTPKTFEKLLPYLNDSLDILEYSYNMVDENGNIISKHQMKPKKCDGVLCGKYFARHRNTTNYLWNKLFRKELFTLVELPELSAGEDYAVLAQLFYFATGYQAVRQEGYQYVMTSDSLSRKPFSRQRLDNIAAGQFVIDFYRHNNPALCPYALQKMCSTAVILYCQCMQSKETDKENICQRLKQVFSKSYKELGLTKMLRIGSLARRMMLLLFTISPQLCVCLYGKRALK